MAYDGTSSEGTTADREQLDFRERLATMFRESPLPPEQLMFNLGLYTRSSLLVKFLFLHDVYQRIRMVPGVLIELGVWWGQNLVLLENLRAIHEPFNKQRVILGFDTFSGYRTFSDEDVVGDVMADGTYSTPAGYREYLERLLEVHEGANAFGHRRGGHRLIEGDACETVPRYFDEHPETLVAMAFFDVGTYKPTMAALEAMKSALVPGSVLVFDQLTWPGAPGEAIAFKQVFRDIDYTIEKSALYPSKSIVTLR
ncbi:MAG: dTDP-6-deoxy-L-hexose 3-O-methyltransferase [Proteobacteria bacterium]|nr:dTDP-6-deoxy-L-hexose 3-O-methyltransferase [Burkholderiales bacterium]